MRYDDDGPDYRAVHLYDRLIQLSPLRQPLELSW